MSLERLSSIKIVLVETFHPGNIGAAARAMKTMGLNDLTLVNPLEFPHDEAVSRAAGASDVMDKVTIVDSLEEAIVDCTQVFATTTRQKLSFSRPQNACSEAISWIDNHPNEQIAIVFGCERAGLSSKDINLCQQVLTIPGNPEYDVLNLASAVQIVCYELFKQLNQGAKTDPTIGLPLLANQKEMGSFYQHLQSELEVRGYLREAQPSNTMERLRTFINKAEPTSEDINLLRGLVVALSREVKV